MPVARRPRGRPPQPKQKALTADQVRTWRKAMGWTQEEAADALGIGRLSMSRYENEGAPRTAALAMAALAAGLTP